MWVIEQKFSVIPRNFSLFFIRNARPYLFTFFLLVIKLDFVLINLLDLHDFKISLIETQGQVGGLT